MFPSFQPDYGRSLNLDRLDDDARPSSSAEDEAAVAAGKMGMNEFRRRARKRAWRKDWPR